MLKLHGLSLLLQLALTAPALASLTSVNESSAQPLRIAFAPHPFLSHWAVSAPIAHELLRRGHKALVRHTVCHEAYLTSLVSEQVLCIAYALI